MNITRVDGGVGKGDGRGGAETSAKEKMLA